MWIHWVLFFFHFSRMFCFPFSHSLSPECYFHWLPLVYSIPNFFFLYCCCCYFALFSPISCLYTNSPILIINRVTSEKCHYLIFIVVFLRFFVVRWRVLVFILFSSFFLLLSTNELWLRFFMVFSLIGCFHIFFCVHKYIFSDSNSKTHKRIRWFWLCFGSFFFHFVQFYVVRLTLQYRASCNLITCFHFTVFFLSLLFHVNQVNTDDKRFFLKAKNMGLSWEKLKMPWIGLIFDT